MSYALVQCTCQNEFQDKRYGKGVRVANATLKAKSVDKVGVRCTSCGKEHEVNKSSMKK